MIRLYNAICVLGLVLAGFGAQAQQIIWQEPFDYWQQPGFPSTWRTNGWGSDYDVYIQTSCAPRTTNSTRVAGVSGYELPLPLQPCESRWKHQTNLQLATPLIDLRGKSHPRLKFDSYFLRYQKNGHFERAAVQVSTDSGATWTVLKEVPPTVLGAYNVCQVDLSAYSTAPGAVRVGFFYTDSSEYMPGWLIDNLQIFEPISTDLALVSTNQSDTFRNYHIAPATVTLEGMVVNFGTTPVTSFTAHWQDAAGTIESTIISGVSIQPLDTYRVVHTQPLALNTAVKHQLRMWVNLAGDLKRNNDSLKFSVSGALFKPLKRLVIEDGTGTWNLNGPRGDVFMHRLDTMANPPIRISVHSGDVLEYEAYADHLYYMRQLFAQYFMFDRGPAVHPDAFFSRVTEDQTRFGYADISMKMTYTAGVINADVDVYPAVDLPGKYRVALVLTEDNVRGTTSAYNQANAYANNKIGPMGGYESKPDPVPASDMRYDFVVRDASPGPEGRLGAIGVSPRAGQHYTSTFVQPVGINWRKENLNVIAMLIRDSDSTIMNATIRKLSSLAAGSVAQLIPEARLQPNPASTETILYLDLPRTGQVQVSITDISGRLISTPVSQALEQGEHRWTLPTGNLPPGMYLVRISGPGFQESLKLSVVR